MKKVKLPRKRKKAYKKVKTHLSYSMAKLINEILFEEIGKYKDKINCYLFYGENDGQKLDTIESNFKNFTKELNVIKTSIIST